MGTTLSIRDGREADVPAIQEICRRAVLELTTKSYNSRQRSAWAGLFETFSFAERLLDGDCRVAVRHEVVLGLLSRRPAHHIDLLYVTPEAARQGVASALLADCEVRTRAAGIHALTTEASLVAAPVFEKAGFERGEREQVSRDGVSFTRILMSKRLRQQAR